LEEEKQEKQEEEQKQNKTKNEKKNKAKTNYRRTKERHALKPQTAHNATEEQPLQVTERVQYND
jgi:hypothetical protein